jgi:hypothetical protein
VSAERLPRQSLDEVMAEIHRSSAQQLIEEIRQPTGNSAVDALTARMLAEAAAGPPPRDPEGELMTQQATEILFGMGSKPLSQRQKALPRIDLSKIAGMVAVLFLVVGVGSATYLTQQGQDVRQQASDGRLAQYNDVLTQLNEQSEAEKAEQEVITQQEAAASQRALIGGVMILVAVLMLVSVLFWLFAV